MVVVPAVKAVTTPVLDTVATAVLDEIQGVVGCAVPEPVNVDVKPTQALMVPVIEDNTDTVKVPVMIQPLLLL